MSGAVAAFYPKSRGEARKSHRRAAGPGPEGRRRAGPIRPGEAPDQKGFTTTRMTMPISSTVGISLTTRK